MGEMVLNLVSDRLKMLLCLFKHLINSLEVNVLLLLDLIELLGSIRLKCILNVLSLLLEFLNVLLLLLQVLN